MKLHNYPPRLLFSVITDPITELLLNPWFITPKKRTIRKEYAIRLTKALDKMDTYLLCEDSLNINDQGLYNVGMDIQRLLKTLNRTNRRYVRQKERGFIMPISAITLKTDNAQTVNISKNTIENVKIYIEIVERAVSSDMSERKAKISARRRLREDARELIEYYDEFNG